MRAGRPCILENTGASSAHFSCCSCSKERGHEESRTGQLAPPHPHALFRVFYVLSSDFWTQCCCSVAQSCPTLCDPMDCSTPCPSPSPRAYSHSRPLSQWCHPTVSSSAIPSSSCLQSFPTLEFFLMSWFCASGGQSIGASASTSVLPMNIQGWFPLGLTGLISLQSKRPSRVFSNTTVQYPDT